MEIEVLYFNFCHFPAQADVFDFSTASSFVFSFPLFHLECALFRLLRKFFERLLNHRAFWISSLHLLSSQKYQLFTEKSREFYEI